MDNDLYFLLTLLPPLPELDEPAPVELSEVCRQVSQLSDPGLVRLGQAFLLLEEFESVAEHWVRGEAAPLSGDFGNVGDFLSSDFLELFAMEPNPDGEAEWMSRFSAGTLGFLQEVARAIRSDLLLEWTRLEWGLRKALADIRTTWWNEHHPDVAGKLGSSSDHSQGPEISSEVADLAVRWRDAEDPRAAEDFLDRARWNFISEKSGQYTFSHEELVGYLLKLRLLRRHQSFDREKGTLMLQEVTAL